jgi:large subunit ribosomal protein L35Ae
MSATTKTNTSSKTEKKSSESRVQGRNAQPVRLYVKGAFIGYKRSQANQYNHTALLAIDGVHSAADTAFYAGKRVAYIYRAHTKVRGSNYRVIWGRIARPHGNNGVVRAKFRNNLPARALGATVRVMLYPSNI